MGRLLALLLILAIPSCSSTQQRQGIKGHVFWISGNQLPGPENPRSAHAGIQREILVYEKTTLHEVTRLENGFFIDIKTNLVATFMSDPDGSFKFRLLPGKYSVFVKEEDGLFANVFDKDNIINPIVVKDKQYSWLPINIDYKASY